MSSAERCAGDVVAVRLWTIPLLGLAEERERERGEIQVCVVGAYFDELFQLVEQLRSFGPYPVVDEPGGERVARVAAAAAQPGGEPVDRASDGELFRPSLHDA